MSEDVFTNIAAQKVVVLKWKHGDKTIQSSIKDKKITFNQRPI